MLLSLLLIVAATLWPQPGSAESGSRSSCLLCSDAGLADAVANVLLFVPLGLTLAFRREGARVGRVIVAAFLVSASIEAIQYFGVVSGRQFSIVDIACNTLGATIGALVGMALPRLSLLSVEAFRRFFVIWCIGAHVMLFVFGWLLQRSVEPGNEGTPIKSSLPFPTGYGWFSKQVPWADVDGVRFEQRGSGPILVSSPVRVEQRLRVQVIGRDARETFVPVVFVHAAGDRMAHLSLGQFGSDYGLRVRTNASRFGLQLPSLVIDALEVAPKSTNDSTTAELGAMVTMKTWTFSLKRDGDSEVEHTASLRVRPALGWMLFLPIRNANGAVAGVGTTVLILLVCIPLFLISASAGLTAGRTVLIAIVASLSVLIVPAWLLSLSMPTVGDVSCVAAAAAASALWRKRTGRELKRA